MRAGERVMLALKYSAGTKSPVCINQTYQLKCLQTIHINHNTISTTSSRRLTVLIAVAFFFYYFHFGFCFCFYLRQQNYPFAITIYFMIFMFCSFNRALNDFVSKTLSVWPQLTYIVVVVARWCCSVLWLLSIEFGFVNMSNRFVCLYSVRLRALDQYSMQYIGL